MALYVDKEIPAEERGKKQNNCFSSGYRLPPAGHQFRLHSRLDREAAQRFRSAERGRGGCGLPGSVLAAAPRGMREIILLLCVRRSRTPTTMAGRRNHSSKRAISEAVRRPKRGGRCSAGRLRCRGLRATFRVIRTRFRGLRGAVSCCARPHRAPRGTCTRGTAGTLAQPATRGVCGKEGSQADGCGATCSPCTSPAWS